MEEYLKELDEELHLLSGRFGVYKRVGEINRIKQFISENLYLFDPPN